MISWLGLRCFAGCSKEILGISRKLMDVSEEMADEEKASM